LGGTVLSISFGNKSSKNFTLAELIELYSRTPFIAYVVFFVFYMSAAFLYLRNVRKRRVAGTPRSYDARLESVAYPSLAGTFGAHSVLFAKSTAEVVKQTARGDNQFAHPASYFFILFLFLFLFLQMRILNEGLSKADALVIVPVYQVCWVMMNTVVGMVYFEDYKEMIPWHTFLFLLGVAITLAGVFLLSKRDNKPVKPVQIQEEGGYIEEVVSSLDDSDVHNKGEGVFSNDDLPPPLTKVDEHNENEESEVRNPFIDASMSGRDLTSQGKAFSNSSLPLSPSATSENGSKMKPLDIGDVEEEEEAVAGNSENNGNDNDGNNPINHPPNKAGTRSHSRSFSLSWSWWARGGTRKLYTPLF
jgi:hypothetical protein